MARYLVQVKAKDGDKAAMRDAPTLDGVKGGDLRYSGIISAKEGQLLELHLDDGTAKLLLDQLYDKRVQGQ